MKFAAICALLAAAACVNADTADAPRPKYLEGIGIDQKLNSQLPLNATFRDEQGNTVTLGSLLHGRPAIFALVYYSCPALCDQILHGVVNAMRPLGLKPGRDFDVIAISINPADTPDLAAEKRLDYVNMYSRGASLAGWHFLTGDQPNIRRVADAAGFHYRYDPASKMFFHGAGIMVITPEGKLARYLYGVSFEPKDVKLSLMDASHNRIGSPVDKILLFCCRYDAASGKYTLAVLNLLRVAAALTLAFVVAALFWLWRRDLVPVDGRTEARHP